MRKFITAFLAVSMLLLAGCGSKGISHGDVKTNSSADTKVFEYGSSYITSGLYGYIFSEEKTDYLYVSSEYAEYLSGSPVADTVSFWNKTASNGKTFAKLLTDNINDYCKELVTVKELASKNNVKVTNKEDLTKIDTIVEDLINDHGSENDLDLFLYKFGIKTSDLRNYYNDVFLIEALKDFYYGENGSRKIPDNEITGYFFDNYVKFTHIFIKFGVTPGETTEETRERAKTLFEDIKSGKEIFEDHLDDSYDKHDPVVLGKGEAYEEFEKAVFDAGTGEYIISEFDKGVYIVRKEELAESDISDSYQKIESALIDEAFGSYLKEFYDQIIINSTELSKYDIATADTFD